MNTAGAALGVLDVVDVTAGTTLATVPATAAGWQQFSATFTAPAAHDHELRVVLRSRHPSLSGTAWFDDILIGVQQVSSQLHSFTAVNSSQG